jgi:hypothetical protein
MINVEFPTSLKIQHCSFTTQHSQLRVALSYHADFFRGNGGEPRTAATESDPAGCSKRPIN